MKDVLNKLGSYNLFNYLLPGILFSITVSYITKYSLIHQDIVTGIFLYYFIGLVISRLGSLLIQPSLIRINIISFVDCKKFVLASRLDPKIELLSEQNNMYRTFIALFIAILFTKGYESVDNMFHFSNHVTIMLLITALLALFILSYKKQTEYIAKRTKITNKKI